MDIYACKTNHTDDSYDADIRRRKANLDEKEKDS